MTNRELAELAQRVDEIERAFGDVCKALMAIEEHLPKVVLWQPGVKEALQIAQETCKRAAERLAHRSHSKPPSAPKIPTARKI